MNELPQLNLPPFAAKVKTDEKGTVRIFDSQRAKFVALTPEEWVRQHFVAFLVNCRQYPAHLIANEVGLKQNGAQRRCDTVIYDGFARAVAIVEYKAPEVAITAKVFDQIVRYNMVLGVRCLMVSNGLKHYCCVIDSDTGQYRFLRDIPPYGDIVK